MTIKRKAEYVCRKLYQNISERYVFVIEKGSSTVEVGNKAVEEILRSKAERGNWIKHDKRGAPFLRADGDGEGRNSIWISLTDETDYAAALVVASPESSSLAGVGIDLASVSDFSKDRHFDRFCRFLFCKSEMDYLYALPERKQSIAACSMFSVKEAVIKSIGGAVQSYEESHGGAKMKAIWKEIDLVVQREEGVATVTNFMEEQFRAMGVSKVKFAVCADEGYAFAAAACFSEISGGMTCNII